MNSHSFHSLQVAASLAALATVSSLSAQTLVPGAMGTVPTAAIARMDAQSPINAVAADFAGNALLWDGTSWTTLPLGFASNPSALLADSTIDGQYIVGSAGGDVAIVVSGSVTAQPMVAGSVQGLAGNTATGLFAATTAGCFSSVGGGAWVPVGAAPITGAVLDVEVTAAGLVAVGSITVPGGAFTSAATFDGTNWAAIPGAPAFEGEEVHVMSNGDFVMSSRVPGSSVRTVSRFVPSSGTWTTLTSNVSDRVEDIEELPNGDPAICGSFAQIDGFSRPSLARFDGFRWQAITTSIGGGATIRSMVFTAPNRLLVAGSFANLDGSAEAGVAAYGPTTDAFSIPFGPQCGINLTTVALPFIGTSTVAVAGGLQPGLLLHLIGENSMAPTPVGPMLGANSTCDIEVDAIVVESFAVNTPSFAVSIAIPQDPSLIGQALFQQAVNWTNSNDAFTSEPIVLIIGEF